jgi:hypothetical protein
LLVVLQASFCTSLPSIPKVVVDGVEVYALPRHTRLVLLHIGEEKMSNSEWACRYIEECGVSRYIFFESGVGTENELGETIVNEWIAKVQKRPSLVLVTE